MSKQREVTIKEQLQSVGLRATPGRIVVAETLERAHCPLGTPELIRALVPKVLDLTSLYRTLAAFEEQKLVTRISLDARHASYEWIEDEEEHHHHLVCRTCGLIEEIPECHLESLEKRVLADAPTFREITSHSLEFFGICKSCAKKQKTSA